MHVLGRFGFVSYRRFGKARSLRNDWNLHVLGRFGSSSVALARARSLRSDRAVCMLGRCVAIVLGLSVVRSPYSILSVAGLDTLPLPWDSRYLIQSRLEQGFIARIFVKILFTKNDFRKKCSCWFLQRFGCFFRRDRFWPQQLAPQPIRIVDRWWDSSVRLGKVRIRRSVDKHWRRKTYA